MKKNNISIASYNNVSEIEPVNKMQNFISSFDTKYFEEITKIKKDIENCQDINTKVKLIFRKFEKKQE